MSIGKQVKSRTASMRHRIVVKYRTTTTNNADTGQPEETWTTRFASEPAAFENKGGGEFINGRKIAATAQAIFTVNYRPGYLETDVIEFDGQTWGIVKIDPPEGVKRYLEIQAKVSE